jgi:hypothetical protein
MKVSLIVGGVEVTLSGVDLTLRQVKDLMRSAGSIALALPPETAAAAEPEKSHPLGFTAHLEIAEPEETILWYDDEE